MNRPHCWPSTDEPTRRVRWYRRCYTARAIIEKRVWRGTLGGGGCGLSTTPSALRIACTPRPRWIGGLDAGARVQPIGRSPSGPGGACCPTVRGTPHRRRRRCARLPPPPPRDRTGFRRAHTARPPARTPYVTRPRRHRRGYGEPFRRRRRSGGIRVYIILFPADRGFPDPLITDRPRARHDRLPAPPFAVYCIRRHARDPYNV